MDLFDVTLLCDAHKLHPAPCCHSQACFWFNNGCDISCDECDGQTGQVVHPRFVHSGKGEIPAWGGEGIAPDPAQKSPVAVGARPDKSTRLSICKNPKRNATICDPKQRTVNTGAKCGAPDDFFFHSPWRAPGYVSTSPMR